MYYIKTNIVDTNEKIKRVNTSLDYDKKEQAYILFLGMCASLNSKITVDIKW